MLKGIFEDGTGFTIKGSEYFCENTRKAMILEYPAKKLMAGTHTETPYEAETILGELFIQEFGGQITQPSDEPNTTNWGLSVA